MYGGPFDTVDVASRRDSAKAEGVELVLALQVRQVSRTRGLAADHLNSVWSRAAADVLAGAG